MQSVLLDAVSTALSPRSSSRSRPAIRSGPLRGSALAAEGDEMAQVQMASGQQRAVRQSLLPFIQLQNVDAGGVMLKRSVIMTCAVMVATGTGLAAATCSREVRNVQVTPDKPASVAELWQAPASRAICFTGPAARNWCAVDGVHLRRRGRDRL